MDGLLTADGDGVGAGRAVDQLEIIGVVGAIETMVFGAQIDAVPRLPRGALVAATAEDRSADAVAGAFSG